VDSALFKLATWAVDAICSHPSLVAGALVVFILCSLTVNGLRSAWPLEAERPRLIKFLLSFLDIGALNFWRLIQAFKKPDPNPPLANPHVAGGNG
jgi:hypothetical protein